jgi:hypothetical protein
VYLPGRLSRSTLGDLLGALHRHRVTGVIELRELSESSGLCHRIALVQGLVAQVDTPLARGMSMRDRLEALFALGDASVRFRTGRATSAGTLLSPRDFLHGRPRRRDRSASAYASSSPRESALRILGLPPDADSAEVRRAFRRLALEHHPDRHPGATADEQRSLAARLSQVCSAYRSLTG